MNALTGLTSTPVQKFQVPINGNVADIILTYRPSVQMWFIDITYLEIEIKGMRVCHNLNLLAQYNTLLKFGLYVEMNGAVEPALIDDFFFGRVVLNILDESELDLIQAGYSSLRQTE